MKTEETISMVCSELGITRAELAKRMGMLPSSLYRKLARESMTFEELQRCLDVLEVAIEFNLQYPDGREQNSRTNHELILQKMELLEKKLQAEKKSTDFHRKSLQGLRAELSSAVGYAELGIRHPAQAEDYLKRIQSVLSTMELTVSYALGEEPEDEYIEDGSEETGHLAGKRVLIVDDNSMNREILREILTDHGLEVWEAGDGKEAISQIQSKDPGYLHFVLMDLEMPAVDGYEATLKIRKLPNRIRANIPIIALTANSIPENREKAAIVGMDGFLVKPVNSARLIRCLTRYI